MPKPFDLSDRYWDVLSPAHQALYSMVRPQPKAAYTMDSQLGYVETFIAAQTLELPKMGGSFELEPDFQRGHVWTEDQRKAYIEALLRSTAPNRIIFNCPGWINSKGSEGDIPAHTFQCVDGLQRLTAVRKFMAGEIAIFDGFTVSDFKGTPFDAKRYRLQFCVFEFCNRADLLQFYLDLNGGTVHPQSELDRVRKLRDAALPSADRGDLALRGRRVSRP